MILTTAIVALVLAYTWLLAPMAPPATASVVGAAVIAIAVARALRTREWGLAGYALVPALRLAAAFTAVAGAAIFAAGWQMHTWHDRPSLWSDAALLIPWTLAQQFALQTVLLRESQQATTRTAGIVIAAALFAALHLPNPFLTIGTFVAALAWCTIFARHPNVVPLAASHALLTLVVLSAFNDAVTGRLRVGAGYLGLR